MANAFQSFLGSFSVGGGTYYKENRKQFSVFS